MENGGESDAFPIYPGHFIPKVRIPILTPASNRSKEHENCNRFRSCNYGDYPCGFHYFTAIHRY